MRLFRFLAYLFAFFLGAVFAFRGTNTFPAPPPGQYKKVVRQPASKGEPSERLPKLDAKAQIGKSIFTAQCASCHNRNLKDDLIGPALDGVRERWGNYPGEDLYQWIRNSQAMIDAGHPRAQELWKDWGPSVMNSFPSLNDDDIDAILAYIEAI